MRRFILSTAASAMLVLAAPGAALAQAGPVTAVQGPSGATPSGFVSGRVQVFVDGPSRPQGEVILIPGLTSSPAIWQGLTDGLKDRYRVHRVHVSGFAGAPSAENAEGPVAAPVAEEIARYIADQGLQAPTVIGHSMGGTMAMMLAARHPSSVGRLMVVDMVPFMGVMFGPPGATADSVRPAADMIRTGMSSSSRADWIAQSRASIEGMIQTESLRPGPIRDAETSDQQTAANSFHELIVTDLRPELAAITAPTRVLYVKFNDPRMTPEITDQVYRLSFATLPGADLIRIDDSAHFIMLDQPERFLAEVQALLD